MCDIHYGKSKKIDLGKLEKQYLDSDLEKEAEKKEEKRESEKVDYNPFRINALQNYNPMYSLFFEMNNTNYNAISLNHPYHFLDLHTILAAENDTLSTEIHIKYAPLLDPIHYLIGKYEKERSRFTILPNLTHGRGLPKIEHVYNSAYVDCFFSYLVSNLFHKYGFRNGIDFYGSYLGVQEKFKMDISDDYEYLTESDFFLSKKNVLYELESSTNLDTSPLVRTNLSSSCSMKPKLSLGEIVSEHIELDVDILEEEEVFENPNQDQDQDPMELIYDKKKGSDSDSELKSDSDSDSDDNSVENYSTEEEEKEEEEWSDIDEDEDEEEESFDEPIIHAYIRDFPIQMICLEKGEGTLDALLENNELEDPQLSSALFQIVMSLAAFQKAYDFTHNDLHTNNIIYFSTKYTHMEYIFLGKTYKVPTYGRIYKIIDFGRSIYKFQDKILSSDSFALGGDAHGQYNCEPFLNTKKPVINPNPSFDLCRLGCALYDFVFDGLEEDEIRSSRKKWTEIQKTIARWCMDDKGKNILYKSSGEERYPNFKLYKMIGRMVHDHTPEKQMGFSLFSQYDVAKKNEKKKKMLKPVDILCKINIDVIPKCFV